ncbi:unnamed protein product [Lampetra planeri]
MPQGTAPVLASAEAAADVAAAVAVHTGLAAVRVVQRENRGYVVYVATVEAAARVVERGLSIGGEGACSCSVPLSQRRRYESPSQAARRT